MSILVRKEYPDHRDRISWMQGIGYTLRRKALLRAQKSEIDQIVLSFLGMKKDPLIHVEQPVGDRKSMPTR